MDVCGVRKDKRMLERSTNDSMAIGEDAGHRSWPATIISARIVHISGKVKMLAHLRIYPEILLFVTPCDPRGPGSIYNQAEILFPRSYTWELDCIKIKIWVQCLVQFFYSASSKNLIF